MQHKAEEAREDQPEEIKTKDRDIGMENIVGPVDEESGEDDQPEGNGAPGQEQDRGLCQDNKAAQCRRPN